MSKAVVTEQASRPVDEPRRPTPTERLHAALMAAIDRAPSAATKPSFRVSSTKAGAEEAKGGVFERIEWDVHVPVCDEFPSADEAHAASLRYARAYAEAFPPTRANGKNPPGMTDEVPF